MSDSIDRIWCSYCDFQELDDDPQDCTCEEYCGEEGCSGEGEIEDDSLDPMRGEE